MSRATGFPRKLPRSRHIWLGVFGGFFAFFVVFSIFPNFSPKNAEPTVEKYTDFRIKPIPLPDDRIYRISIENRQFYAISENFPEDLVENLTDFSIIRYKNREKVDFFEFSWENGTRIVPKFIFGDSIEENGHFLVKNSKIFEKFWRFSRKIECRNIDMRRALTKTTKTPITTRKPSRNRVFPLKDYKKKEKNTTLLPKITDEFVPEFIFLRDFLISNGQIPILFFGTLLGWYRECGIIPHTNDLDLGIRESEVTDEFLRNLESLKSGPLWLDRRFGLRNESLEYTVKSLKHKIPIDIFLLYDTKNETYASGQSKSLDSYRFVFPKITEDEICAANFLNHFFYVPCQAERHIRHEHGDEWSTDRPTKGFSWSRGVKNWKKHKRYPKAMRELVEHYFDS